MINKKLHLSHLFWLNILAVLTPCMWSVDTNQCVFENPASHPHRDSYSSRWKYRVPNSKSMKKKTFSLSSAVSLNGIMFCICYLTPHFLRHKDIHRVSAKLHQHLTLIQAACSIPTLTFLVPIPRSFARVQMAVVTG